MNRIFYIFSSALVIVLFSCKKESNNANDCFLNLTTSRQIVNKPAIVKQQPSGLFYIIEQGSIDIKLYPCNLTNEFKVDDLQVTISGDVKSIVQGETEPCCTENFVITKILR